MLAINQSITFFGYLLTKRMNLLLVFSAAAAVVLSLAHLFINRITVLEAIPRSKWLSVAGGISVTYIFLHVLPELEEWQKLFTAEGEGGFLKHHLYVVALIGLAVYYGLERAAKLADTPQREAVGVRELSSAGVFRIHIALFAVYNLLIGYLLVHRDVATVSALALFTLAMLFHFVVNDHGLQQHYPQRYQARGRWIVSGAVLLGWFVGVLLPVSESGVAIVFAFIAGGNIMNTLKEELPEERKSNYWAFFAGIVGYTLLLLLAG
jgi:hypothetical protein